MAPAAAGPKVDDVRLRFFGGLEAEADDAPIEIRGRGQEALLFRLALDAGTTVAYRSLAEDVWPDDLPDDPRASLQSLASRLRRAVPAGTLEAVPGGYRLAVAREHVDIALFQDLVARARHAEDPVVAVADARAALALWRGEPWTPGEGFDWVVRDLLEDRAHAERIAGAGAGDPIHGAAPTPLAPAAAVAPTAPAMPGGVAPALATAPTVPASLTPLIGRTRELELIESQLRAERLVTLIGPGAGGAGRGVGCRRGGCGPQHPCR